jgi:hypothetical protein
MLTVAGVGIFSPAEAPAMLWLRRISESAEWQKEISERAIL